MAPARNPKPRVRRGGDLRDGGGFRWRPNLPFILFGFWQQVHPSGPSNGSEGHVNLDSLFLILLGRGCEDFRNRLCTSLAHAHIASSRHVFNGTGAERETQVKRGPRVFEIPRILLSCREEDCLNLIRDGIETSVVLVRSAKSQTKRNEIPHSFRRRSTPAVPHAVTYQREH